MGPTLAEPELLRAFLAVSDAPCPRCGYNLRGLPGLVCPECSALIQLGISGVEPLWRLRWLAASALAIVAVYRLIMGAWTVLSLILGEYNPPTGMWWFQVQIALSAGISGGVGIAAAWGLFRLVRRWRRGRDDERPVTRAAVYIMWLVVIDSLLWLALYAFQIAVSL
jgi:multisubunit Na+/H+ antiporter MnhB subunit